MAPPRSLLRRSSVAVALLLDAVVLGGGPAVASAGAAAPPAAEAASTGSGDRAGGQGTPPTAPGLEGAPSSEPPVSARCTPDRGYRPPVSAPVTDPFRAPADPFGPGNRGLEYGTAPGTPVRAIGPGTVVFAGQVGGQLHVTVRHPDGLRSTYSYLAEVAVAVDHRIARGELVGRAGARLHLGVRCGTAYLDPAPLLVGRWRARLVPDHRFPAGGGAGGSRSPPRS